MVFKAGGAPVPGNASSTLLSINCAGADGVACSSYSFALFLAISSASLGPVSLELELFNVPSRSFPVLSFLPTTSSPKSDNETLSTDVSSVDDDSLLPSLFAVTSILAPDPFSNVFSLFECRVIDSLSVKGASRSPPSTYRSFDPLFSVVAASFCAISILRDTSIPNPFVKSSSSVLFIPSYVKRSSRVS